MSVKLLTKNHLEFLASKDLAQARLSLHLSKGQIVGNHMSWLNIFNKDDWRKPIFYVFEFLIECTY